jgi:hypothetical protein
MVYLLFSPKRLPNKVANYSAQVKPENPPFFLGGR